MGKKLRVAIIALCLPGLAAFGQWVKVPPLKAPRTKSGEIDLKAPAPRLADGRPDLSGSWSPGWEPMEFICGENNTDLPHLPGQ